jgi:hypothetical protein
MPSANAFEPLLHKRPLMVILITCTDSTDIVQTADFQTLDAPNAGAPRHGGIGGNGAFDLLDKHSGILSTLSVQKTTRRQLRTLSHRLLCIVILMTMIARNQRHLHDTAGRRQDTKLTTDSS